MSLVGFGAIGRAVATLLQGFGVEILHYDPVRVPAETKAALNWLAGGTLPSSNVMVAPRRRSVAA